VTKIGGGAAAGAIIGAIAGGGKGAAIGAGVGAAAGTGVAAATGKKDAKVESEAVLTWTTAGDSTAYSGSVPRGSAPAAFSAPPRSYSDEDDDDRGNQGNSDWQIFSSRDRRAIRSCFQENESNLPPGLAKREQLPPGLQKQLERNGTLPPGLQKRVQPLPDVCENQLGPLPQGVWRGIYSRRVMLIDQDNRILDAFNLDDR